MLDRLVGWLRSGGEADLIVPAVSTADDRGVDRLFRQLVPDVTGRRSGHEIIHRLRRKWDLSHSLSDILGRVRDQVHALSGLHGPAAGRARAAQREVRRARPAFGRRRWESWSQQLGGRGVDEARIELDLGFSRGIGFYTQMIFELEVSSALGLARRLRRRPLRRAGPRARQQPRRPRGRLCIRARAPGRGLRGAAARRVRPLIEF